MKIAVVLNQAYDGSFFNAILSVTTKGLEKIVKISNNRGGMKNDISLACMDFTRI